MKRSPLWALMVALLFLVGCGDPPLSVDPSEFVGTWRLSGEGDRVQAIVVMNADGTFTQDVNSSGPMENLLIGDLKCSGTWKIEKGYVVWDVTESTNNQQVQAGKTYYDWIKNFTSKDSYTLVNEQGFREEYHWVPEEPVMETFQEESSSNEQVYNEG